MKINNNSILNCNNHEEDDDTIEWKFNWMETVKSNSKPIEEQEKKKRK